MNAFGISGWSGSGKTTLIERLLPRLSARGLVVGVLKHAHHGFEIDREGKDSYRFRAAGCREVALSSSRRWVFMHDNIGAEPELPELLSRFDAACNLILVEGYKNAPLPKLEVWRQSVGKTPIALDNPAVVALAATTAPPSLPAHCRLLPLDDAAAIADFIAARVR